MFVLFSLMLRLTGNDLLYAVEDDAVKQGELTPVKIDSQKNTLFGMQFFQQISSPQLSFTGGQVSVDYPLGPGDALGIYLGDKAQQFFEVRVSADGKIYIPTVGLFDVNGTTLEDLRTQLDKRLQRLYSNYIVDIMLLTPKQIRISVVGEVNMPGNYSLSSLHNVSDALMAAKGLAPQGSLRNIQLWRNDSLLTYIDLYDFLLRPASPEQLYLHDGDRIFVPVSRSAVQIDGQVYREHIYELSQQKQERLSDIIELAGGLRDAAYSEKIEISRMEADGRRSLYYINYHSITGNDNDTYNLPLRNNDRIHVYSILEKTNKETVAIYGEVKKPGEYNYEKNMRVSDLILKAGGVNRSAYMLEASVARVDPLQPFKPEQAPLAEIMDNPGSARDIQLEADDQVFIRRIPKWQVGPVVEVRGEVKFPGYYPIIKDSTTLSQIITNAGGLTDKANVQETRLFRATGPEIEDKEFARLKSMRRTEMSDREYDYFVMRQNSSEVSNIVVDFYKLLVKNDLHEDVFLENGDIIIVPEKPRVVMVTGRVGKEGGIVFKENANLDYYIGKAGGFAWDADSKHTKVILTSGDIKDDEDVKKFNPGDRIWVPRKPDRDYWKIFLDTMLVIAQIATVYIVIDSATN